MTKRRWYAVLASLALLVGSAGSSVYAATTTPPSQEVASKAFGSDIYLPKGTIVTLKVSDPSKVVAANAQDIDRMLGVVIAPNDSPLVLSGSNSTDQTYVATSGRYNVLVSNQNGPIAPGDYVTVSSLNGIGMKTGTTQGLVLGTAATAFQGSSDTISTAQLATTAKAQPQTINIGMIQVDINIGENPFLYHSVNGIPKSLSIVSQTISGRPVSSARIYASLAVLLMCMIITGILMYSGIRGSFSAIGRNPLARRSIIRGMVQVIVTAFIVFTFGLLGVYLILKL